MEIVGVQFQDKFKAGEFTGREYNYFVADNLDLKVGDIVEVPVKDGSGTAKVARIGVRESQIDKRILPLMKVIVSGTERTQVPAEADKRDLIEKKLLDLQSKKSLRDSMGGDLYRNILNDECLMLADEITAIAHSIGIKAEIKQRILDMFHGEWGSK